MHPSKLSNESLHDHPDGDDVKMPALEAHKRSTSITDTDNNMMASESIDEMNDGDFQSPYTDYDPLIELSHSFSIPPMPSLPPLQSTGTTPPISPFSNISFVNESTSPTLYDYSPAEMLLDNSTVVEVHSDRNVSATLSDPLLASVCLPNLDEQHAHFDNEASMRYIVGIDDFFSTPTHVDDEDTFSLLGAEEEANVTPTMDATSATLLSPGGGSRWSDQFELLKQYKVKHGHCDVPQKAELSELDDDWKGLGSWVNKVRVSALQALSCFSYEYRRTHYFSLAATQ